MTTRLDLLVVVVLSVLMLAINLSLGHSHGLSEEDHVRLHKLQRQRARLAKKKEIKKKMEAMLNMRSMSGGANSMFPNNQLDVTERIQSFLPECSIEDHYMQQMPDLVTSEALIFKLRFPTTTPGTTISLADAKLRVYVRAGEEVEADEGTSFSSFGKSGGSADDCPVETRYRITVSWVPLKNKNVRVSEPIMLDSTMVAKSFSGWVSFDVSGAARFWYGHKHRPAALSVQVETERKIPVKTSNIIQSLNCTSVGDNASVSSSGRSAAQTVPGHGPVSQHSSVQRSMRPVLDITTLQSSDDKIEKVHIHPKLAFHDQDDLYSLEQLEEDDLTAPLEKVQEIDYLGPSPAETTPPPIRRTDAMLPSAASPFKPVFTRVVLSKEEMVERLAEYQQIKDEDRELEDKLLVEFVKRLMEKQQTNN